MSHVVQPEVEVAEAARTAISFEEWLANAPDSRLTEWVDGEVIEMSPIHDLHDAISRWLIALLSTLLDERPVGYLRAAPFALKLTRSARGREPDLMFIRAEHADRLHPTYVEGPVDAVFEIVSPESEERDESQKFGEYEREGIPEYWLMDPHRQQLRLYRLGEDGRYHLVTPQEGRFESTQIAGFYLRPEWLWSRPMPRLLDVLSEWGLL